jgi:two-component response regulator ARR-A family
MAATATSPAISAPTKPAGDRKVEQEQMHVLAVDDSNVDRAVIAKILRGSKYRGAPPLFDHARSAAYYHA